MKKLAAVIAILAGCSTDVRAPHVPAIMAANGKCPADKPFEEWGGKCFPCDTEEDLSFSRKCREKPETCEKICPGREIIKYDNFLLTSRLKCPVSKPLRQWDGKCFSCDTKGSISIDSECNMNPGTCEHFCPNREIVYQVGGNPGSMLKCSDDRPLRDEHEECHACDYELDISMKYQPPKKCGQVCPNRFQDENDFICKPKTAKRYRASFECGDITKLQSHERKICENERLGELDIKMAGLYKKVLEKFKDVSAESAKIKSEQKEWLKKTREQWNLIGSYETRIKELEELLK